MEVVIPVAATDFHFDSTCSSPYISAPSTPKGFGHYYSFYSAPTSPSRASAIYNDVYSIPRTASPRMSFNREKKPGTPKSDHPGNHNENEDDKDYDFAFDFNGQLEEALLTTAEELFDHGKIRPLKPLPRLQLSGSEEIRKSHATSPKSPKIFRSVFSPRKRRDVDPYAAAIEETRKGSERVRGREREAVSNPTNSSRRGTRSLSPLRGLDSKPSSASSSLKGSGRKWRFTDFLLFRSASEGRATDKDPLRKYRKGAEDVKNASFRSTDSGGSVSGSRKGPVSAHELHYTANRAASEQMKRKTYLPYRQGLLGFLGFNPTVHGTAKGFDSSRRG